MIKTKKQVFIIVGAFILVLALFTTSYAFFNYTRTGSSNTIRVGKISFNHTQGQSINLTNMFPIDVTNGIPNDNTKVGEVIINVTGDTTYSEGIEYLVTAVNVSNTVGSKSLPISIDVTVEDNDNNDPATSLGIEDESYFTNRGGNASTSIYKVLASDAINEGDQLLVGYIKPGATGVDGNIIIKAYIDASKVVISDTYPAEETDTNSDGYLDGTPTSFGEGKTVLTTTEWNSLQTNGVSFQVKVEANEGMWVEEPSDLKVKKAIAAKEADTSVQCSNITYEEDGITYLSGTNECVDMNYVWYSGKLWRITAIYPDGAMKLVTQNNITSIAFNESSVNFYTDANTTSYMHEWLNEDFYDTLYNANNIIDTGKEWDIGTTSDISTKPSESVNISANVGLLNSYEYYNSYRNLGSSSNGYLNIWYYWWLLNPYSVSYTWCVNSNGTGDYEDSVFADGARPSIYLKSGLEFTGDGSISNPYKVVGDKDVGHANEPINTRISGEYVKLRNGNNEQMFRIICVEDNKTKMIAMDYADNKAKRKFTTSTESSDTLWGSGTTTDADTWYTYLNTTSTGYLDTLKSRYGELFDSGLYYLGTTGYNYKLGVCANITSGDTKVCDKTSQVGTFSIGLPRYGEMFATQQDIGVYTPIDMWLMNRYSESRVWLVYDYGYGSSTTNAMNKSYGARPTVHLKSTVKIISGTGIESDPYVVGL